jgi:Ca2+-binding RTX toxin-like protein
VFASGFDNSLALGLLDVSQFVLGSAAVDASDRFIYDNSIGALFFDPDGIGSLGQVQFARLSGNPTLTHSDIFVV